jgi:acetyl-CoA acetyltransferase family protein
MLGEGDIYLAGGVESMSRAPFVVAKNEDGFPRSLDVFDTSIGWRFINPKMQELYGTESMGETAENLAALHEITRSVQDEYAVQSQRRYQKALERGFFQQEIIPVEVKSHPKAQAALFAEDEFPRPDTSLESLSKLKPAFRNPGTVTAGNSSGINDGACALLMANDQGLHKLGDQQPLARIVAYASAGVLPSVMGLGPVPAIQLALEHAKLTLSDMDLIEINEAFAAQILACTKELGINANDENFNPHGGALALGHPLGMSGARLLLTTARALQERKGRYAVVALCVGVGQGVACVIEATH